MKKHSGVTGIIGFNAEAERARREREHWAAEQRRAEAAKLLEMVDVAHAWQPEDIAEEDRKR